MLELSRELPVRPAKTEPFELTIPLRIVEAAETALV
jgi:hypothetical protein